jgi:CRISPR/Cas system-associated endonuclease Cas1
MSCVLNPKYRLETARALVTLKLETLPLKDRNGFTRKLTRARSIQDAIAIEAEASATAWRLRKGFPLSFKDGSTITFASRARSWRTGRLGETGKQFSNRFALDPFNAMLNYSGAIIVAQITRASAGLGLDPAFGVLHSDRPGMSALAWDIFELLRIRTENAVFDFISSRIFVATDFKLERFPPQSAHSRLASPKPHIRFNSTIARDLAAHVLRRVSFQIVVKTCRTVAGLF